MGKKREVKQPVNVESPVALEEKAKGEKIRNRSERSR